MCIMTCIMYVYHNVGPTPTTFKCPWIAVTGWRWFSVPPTSVARGRSSSFQRLSLAMLEWSVSRIRWIGASILSLSLASTRPNPTSSVIMAWSVSPYINDMWIFSEHVFMIIMIVAFCVHAHVVHSCTMSLHLFYTRVCSCSSVRKRSQHLRECYGTWGCEQE